MKMSVIENVIGRVAVLRGGKYSVEVDVITSSGFGRFAAPVDENPALYVAEAHRAVSEVDEIIGPELIGFDASDQELIDSYLWEIDGTEDFSHIGANTALAVSVAVAKAASSVKKMPLYSYLGGTFTTELPVPILEIASTETFTYYVTVRDLMEITDITDAVNSVLQNAQGLSIEELSSATEKASEELGLDVALGISQKKPLETEELLSIVEDNNIAYIKPIGDEELFLELIAGTHEVFIDGEHLFREKGILDRRYYNALSIKPINLGTLTDVYNLVNDAKSERITPIMSEAKYESSDEALAHIAVGLRCPAMVLWKDSIAKLNELIRIAEDLGERGRIITFEG
ncbi:MAG: enolase [Thermococcaceae archaeon]|nr:enolase [Thermococcaceae archaeon]MDK2913849.1 enolase [Thermococcaceae archaeon]